MTLRLEHVTFGWPDRPVLDDASLTVEAGEVMAIMGPSGSGKSTLLNLMAGIMVPDSGSVQLGGTEISSLSISARAAFRLQNFGIVFQFGELLPELSVLENVSLPLRLQRAGAREAEKRAFSTLATLAVESLAEVFPAQLSGGEMQRVGIARALAHDPKVVLADEPTGALDEDNGRVVSRLLIDAAREKGAAVVIATHDQDVAAMTDRTLRLRFCKLTDQINPTQGLVEAT